MMLNDALFSAKRSDWETPPEIFDRYNKIYHFDVDVCASKENAKVDRYYTKSEDGLKKEWRGNCWCNPPYGRDIGRWVKKAAESKDATTVMLLPARTDTKWFHEYVLPMAEVEFLRGRVKFVGAKYGAPFPSMIVIFKKRRI